MKAQLIAAGIAVLAISALAPAAWADGPRPSSENNWRGMTEGMVNPALAATPQTAEPATAPAPRYVWEEGYDRGGKWHGHWTLVR